MSTWRNLRRPSRRHGGVAAAALLVAVAVGLLLTLGAASGAPSAQHRPGAAAAASNATSSAQALSHSQQHASFVSRASGHAAQHSLSGSSSSLLPGIDSTTSASPRSLAAIGCGPNGTLADDSGFEDADGNLAVDTNGCVDWNSFAPVTWTGAAPYQTASGTSGPFAFAGATDAIDSHSDTIYAGGVKQADECPATDQGNVNFKTDIARIYVAATIGSNGDEYLDLAWVRAPLNNTSSDAHIAFEINQSATACANNDGFVQRTKGDLLLSYDFQAGGATIGISTWTGTTWTAATMLNASQAEAKVFDSNGSVTDDLKPAGTPNPGTQEFGEAGIDLTAAGTSLPSVSGRACDKFATVFGETRTSGSSTSAQMKDFVGPANLNLSTCATPMVATTQEPSSGSTGDTFKDKATVSGLVTPDRTGKITFTLYPQQNCMGAPLDTETVSPVSANGDYETPTGVQINNAGTYYWVASFSGDNFNNPNASGCNDEPVTVNAPSLAVTKTADASTVNAGDPIGFTIAVSNSAAAGTGTAKGVTLSDPLPPGTASAWTIAPPYAGPGSCTINGAVGAQELDCSFGDLAPGAGTTVHVGSTTDLADCTAYDNTATAHATNGPSAQGSARIICLTPGLNVIKTPDAATVDAGDPIGFTITVGNGGPGAAVGVSLVDPLPAGSTAGWTLDSNSNPGLASCAIVPAGGGGQELDCSSVVLLANDHYTLHISAATDFQDCTRYDNTATATALNAAPASGSASIQCQTPSLAVTKTADAPTVNAGDSVGFTISVSNGGPGTAKGVTLKDPLPLGTATPWSIDVGPAQCSINGALGAQELDCASVDLAPNAGYLVHISAQTSFAACTAYDNTATASATNSPDMSASAGIVCRAPSLSVTKTADAPTVNAGDPIGFTVLVSNGGPGTANGVTLTDPLPVGTTAAGWVIDKAPAQCSINGAVGAQELDCTAVDLTANSSYSVHVSAATSFADCTTYDNTATAHATNSPDEPGSATVTCNTAQVSITKTADHSAPVVAGNPIGFTVEIKNTGTGDAGGVTLNDPLPAGTGSGVTWAIDTTTGTPAQFVLNGAKGAQTLGLVSSALPAGADYKVHITAATSETECGSYDNTATLTTGNANDPNPATAAEACAFSVDLSVTKSGSPDSLTLGTGNITWTIVVTNNGPNSDTGVTVTDPMPAGNTFVSASTTQGTCTGGAILSCNIGPMAAGAQVTISLVTTPSTVGAQSNTVTVSGDRPETNTANNTATATVQTVSQQVTPPTVFCVAVSKVTPNQLFVGRKTTLTIHVTKHGKAVKGIHVRIKGPKLDAVTKASNGKGLIKHVVTVKKAGVLIFDPIAGKRCNTKRVGVTNVFTPPVTG